MASGLVIVSGAFHLDRVGPAKFALRAVDHVGIELGQSRIQTTDAYSSGHI